MIADIWRYIERNPATVALGTFIIFLLIFINNWSAFIIEKMEGVTYGEPEKFTNHLKSNDMTKFNCFVDNKKYRLCGLSNDMCSTKECKEGFFGLLDEETIMKQRKSYNSALDLSVNNCKKKKEKKVCDGSSESECSTLINALCPRIEGFKDDIMFINNNGTKGYTVNVYKNPQGLTTLKDRVAINARSLAKNKLVCGADEAKADDVFIEEGTTSDGKLVIRMYVEIDGKRHYIGYDKNKKCNTKDGAEYIKLVFVENASSALAFYPEI